MKKALLLSFAVLSFSANAATFNFNVPTVKTYPNLIMSTGIERLSLNSLDITVDNRGDIRRFTIIAGSDLEYDRAISNVLASYAADICEVTITLTVHVTVETSEGESITSDATGSVVANCDGVEAATNSLRARLVAIAAG